MELTFEQQSFAFLMSFVLGGALGVFYGVIKLLRCIFSPGKAVLAALDVFFMLVWAVSVFYFSLALLRGYIRVYVFPGSLCGFVIWRLTAGRLLSMFYCPVIGFIKSLTGKICGKIKIFIKYLLKNISKVLYNINRRKEIYQINRKSKIKSDSKKRKNNEAK